MKVSILRKAIQEAEKSNQRFGLGAVIFKGSSVYGSGCNDKRSSNIPDKYKRFHHSFHAEIAAIYNVSDWNKLKGSSILVVRLTASGKISKSYPCNKCLNTLKYLGVKNLYYSNTRGEIKRERI